MQRLTTLLMTVLATSALAASPTTAPSTRPASLTPEVQKLIGDLGADDFQTREAASEQLRKLGQAALPALKDAAQSDDPEVRARAESIIAKLEGKDLRPPLDDAGPNRGWRVRPLPGVFNQRVTIRSSNINGQKSVDVDENGRKIHISENADGIKLTVTEQVDGKEATREYAAKNADDLKQNNPDAYALYEKYAGNAGGVQIRVGGAAGGVMINPRVPGAMPPDAMQRLQEAHKRLEQMMRDRELPAQVEERMRERLKNLERRMNPPKDDAKPDENKPGDKNDKKDDIEARINDLIGPDAWRKAVLPDMQGEFKALEQMRAQAQAALEQQLQQMQKDLPAIQQQMRQMQEELHRQMQQVLPHDPAE